MKPHIVSFFFYHFDRPEGQQVVVLLAVAPGVPTRILSLLQDVHLATEVHLLKAHETAGRTDTIRPPRKDKQFKSVKHINGVSFDLRSALDTQGANPFHAHLTHIHAFIADLDHATLEVLLVEHVHLERTGMSVRQQRRRQKKYGPF